MERWEIYKAFDEYTEGLEPEFKVSIHNLIGIAFYIIDTLKERRKPIT
jgi:hypothetical protein